MFRQVVFNLFATASLAVASGQTPKNPAPPPADIPFARLTADAVVTVALEPGAIEFTDGIWIPNRSAGTIVPIDAKKNAAGTPIAAGPAPCGSLVAAFESVWVPLCGNGTLARLDPKAGKVTATLKLALASGDGRIATGIGSIWAITDPKGVLSRIDPATNAVVAEIYVAGGAHSAVFSDEALWITSEAGNVVTRVNPHNNQIVETIEAGPRPGRLAVGEGAVWTLNRGNGSVTRIDPATNKVVATIPLGEAAATGEIAAGLGSVWVSAAGAPISRIDPRSNRAVQRFTGEGGGAVVVAHGSLWVAAGPQLMWRIDPLLVAAIRP
jgi:virginiamycin B lyase